MTTNIKILLTGMLLGAVLTYSIGHYAFDTAYARAIKINGSQVKFKYPIKVTLYRFHLNKDSMAIYRNWVKWHDTEHGPIVETLEREKMYVEAVFRDTINQPEYIYWLTINGEGGEQYTTSNLAVDKKHNEYMKKILLKGSRVVLKTEFMLLPTFVESSILQHQLKTN